MTVEIREIPLTGSDTGPYGITVGTDGALWLTLVQAGGIARLGPDGETESGQPWRSAQ
ncbi:hypothetical protein AB0J68_30155 [Micromonospora sp. NPDC049580]|uniref:hypothetical protein n=1 Tax=Micromonospora sp. NPDC049580 TaxID=3154832 RepID=UPI00342384DA